MRLAIVSSHPIQYHAPWFRFLTENGLPDLRVFYLWNSGVTPHRDHGFGIDVVWDVPLLDGYDHEFVANRAPRPGSASVSGLYNPELPTRLLEFDPDIILMLGYNYLSFYQLLLSRVGRRVPLLFRGDSHRLIPRHGLVAGLRSLWTTSVFRRFARFLFVGQANREYFKLHGVADNQLFFSPHSVDNARFFSQAAPAVAQAAQWRRELGIAPSSRVVLFAGKLEENKRPGDLVAAFREAGLRDATLVFVGNGPQESDLRREAQGMPSVVFVPFQNQSRMPRTYALADVFVLPSKYESWGLAVNEAMCMGRPIIASDRVGCARDLVQSGINGLTFPAGDVSALAVAMRESLRDGDRLKLWGEQSRSIVTNYSYARASDGLFAALESLR